MPSISSAGAKKRKTRHPGYTFRMSRSEPGITQLALADHGLLSLVDELLLNIIDYIDSHAALCQLAATCMRFQGLVEPYVWRNLLVLKGSHALQVARALDSREERIEYIQSMSIRYEDDHRSGIEELNHFLGIMGKLRHLTLETPCPNNSEWRSGVYFDGWSRIDFTNLLASAVYPRLGLPLALPMLQSLTLHAHGAGARKFDLDQAKAMFLHPTLRHITLSCLNFDADLAHDEEIIAQKRGTTALRSLTLIETNVNVQFLDVVLSLPKALEELSIGERLYMFEECEPSMDASKRTSAALFLTALQRQSASLRRLAHSGGMIQWMTARETDPEGAARLRSLVNLEYLELGFESHLYYYLRSNGFPPELKTLKMVDAAISLNAGHNIRAVSDVAFKSITSLVAEHLPASLSAGFAVHLKFSDHSIFRLLVIAHPAEQNRLLTSLFLDRPAIYKIATILKSYNAFFRVSRDTFPSKISTIPPYMYGEELPVEEDMYDSKHYWCFSGIDYQVIDDQKLRDELKGKRFVACVSCRARGISAAECTERAGQTPCVPCSSAKIECRWDEEEVEEEEEEASGAQSA
ncbi:hypothetical protein FB567DRAFT_515383 [Paraphoma chrysanthemicola]|uniref:F-box domain-containing protein n=1 Tax=Paraphoma chrysanthemicola TaxID=798071 RepID=A0A8K0RDA6_9PLEO|nr:hypothetical protein FB567DRAFT_515383 [Paraphoma chrysanthemicola]